MPVKNIVIFGASGQIGLTATAAALRSGYKVRALLREPSKMPDDLREKIDIITGDVTNNGDVKKAVEGQDGVVVCLGTRNDLGPTTVLSEGMKNIIWNMKSCGVDIVSVCISGFLFYEPEKVPAIFHAITADHKKMYDYLKESGLKWIAVFPPHFTDEPSSKYTVKHGSSAGHMISKTDLGTFMVESLTNPEHHNQVCGIAQDKTV